MKQSGIRKFLALCLAVFSLSMLVSGIYGMHSAAKDRKKSEEEIAQLQNDVDRYHSISALLMDPASYDSLQQTLEQKQKNYNEAVRRHRRELTLYTATNGGLESGAQALAQAEAALESGRQQYEAGRQQLLLQAAAFDTIYEAAMAGRKQMDDMLPLLDAAETAVKSLKNLIQSMRAIGDIMELPESAETDADAEEMSQSMTEASTQSDPAASDPQDTTPTEMPDPTQSAGNPDSIDTPELPAETEEPEDPEKSENPEEPGDPENPENPEKPEEPGEPEESEEPENPEEPGAPESPKDPEEPGDPEKPEESDKQEKPETDETPEQETKPTAPVTGDEDHQTAMRQSALKAYEAALSTYADALKVINLLQDREIPTSVIREALKKQGINNADELKSFVRQTGIELGPDQEQLIDTIMTQDTVVLFTSDQVNEFKRELEAAAGMPVDQLMDKMQKEHDEIAAGAEGEYELNAEQFGTIRKAYTENKEAIFRIADVIEKKLPALEATLAAGKAQMAAATKMLDQLENAKNELDRGLDALESAGESIGEGEWMLQEGANQLAVSRKQQNEKAEKLETDKRKLDQAEKELLQITQEMEEHKGWEEEENSLRLALLAREEIRQRVGEGEEILTAADEWLSILKEKTMRMYGQRFNAGLLMVIGVLFAFMTLLTSFAEKGNGLLPAVAALFCLLCCLGAAMILWHMGRGVSYSALVTALLAAACLALSVPGKRHQQQQA